MSAQNKQHTTRQQLQNSQITYKENIVERHAVGVELLIAVYFVCLCCEGCRYGVALDLCDCCNCKVRITSTVKVLLKQARSDSILCKARVKHKHRPTQIYGYFGLL